MSSQPGRVNLLGNPLDHHVSKFPERQTPRLVQIFWSRGAVGKRGYLPCLTLATSCFTLICHDASTFQKYANKK